MSVGLEIKKKYNESEKDILLLGEICLYQYDKIHNLWDTRIGDGKTSVQDLPPLAPLDIAQRVSKLEQEIERLKNNK